MTPNFALNLSEDGIDLLHRDTERNGWVRLRTVPIDSEDLAFELHKLRDAALAIEGDGFASKLILPASQLLYTSVTVEGKKRPKPKIKAALEEQTPYSFDELIYDSVKAKTVEDGRVFQVVAVARETLLEAQAFLAPYMLNPVGFTAMPSPEEFAKEPNLGPVGEGNGFKAEKTPVTILEAVEVDGTDEELTVETDADDSQVPSQDEAISVEPEISEAEIAADSPDIPAEPINAGQKYTAEDLFGPDGGSDDWPKEFEWNEDLAKGVEGQSAEPKAKDETDADAEGTEALFELTDDAAEITPTSDHDAEPATVAEAAEPLETIESQAETAEESEKSTDAEPASAKAPKEEPAEEAIEEKPLVEKPLSERMPNLDAALSLRSASAALEQDATDKGSAAKPDAPTKDVASKAAPSVDDASGFASRRRSRTSFVVPPETGDRVEKLAARIGIPGAAPRPVKSDPVIVRADTQDADKPPVDATLDKTKAPRPEPPVGKRNARARHLIASQPRKPAPLIPPVTVERPVLAGSRGAGLPEDSGHVRVKRSKAPDPIAELAARQAAAEPARSGLLKTFGIVLLIGIIALGSMMALTRGTASWFGSDQMADLQPDANDPEQPEVASSEIAPQDTVLPDETDLVTAPEALALGPVDSDIQSDVTQDTAILPDSTNAIESAEDIVPRLDIETAETAYRDSGVWQFMSDLAPLAAPDLPDRISLHGSDAALTFSGIKPLPVSDQFVSGSAPTAARDVPEGPGLRFVLDENGLVVPTPDGAVSPEGVTVFAGTPPVTPRPRPTAGETQPVATALDTTPVTDQAVPELTAPPEVATAPSEEPTRNVTTDSAIIPFAQAARLVPQSVDDTPPNSDASPTPSQITAQTEQDLPLPPPDPALAAFKPIQRPTQLLELVERETLGGLTRVELASFRPEPRPLAAQERAAQLRAASLASVDAISKAVEEAQEEVLETPEPQQPEGPITNSALSPRDVSVLATFRPSQRPQGLPRIAARIRATRTAPETPTATARATGPAVTRSSRIAPNGPTSTTVARAATDDNAISLGRVALVGVFGTSNNRRALIRMPNGRFKKVTVGDRVDGGRVAAIGEAQLKYTKGGRTLTLNMPQG